MGVINMIKGDILEHGSKASEGRPSAEFEATDIGNKDAFLVAHGKDVRYSVDDERWMIWTGHRWEPDHTNAIRSLVESFSMARLAEARAGLEQEVPANKAHLADASKAGRTNVLMRVKSGDATRFVALPLHTA